MSTYTWKEAERLLARACLAIAPKHYATENAPNSYQDLMYWYNHVNDSDGIPVFNGGSDKTIYPSKKVNCAFRAWHDAIHIAFKLDFSYNDEMKVAEHHVNELHEWSKNLGEPHELICMAAKLVYADVAGQVEYYYHHKSYVDNQKAFVYDYINNGFELPEGEY